MPYWAVETAGQVLTLLRCSMFDDVDQIKNMSVHCPCLVLTKCWAVLAVASHNSATVVLPHSGKKNFRKSLEWPKRGLWDSGVCQGALGFVVYFLVGPVSIPFNLLVYLLCCGPRIGLNC